MQYVHRWFVLLLLPSSPRLFVLMVFTGSGKTATTPTSTVGGMTNIVQLVSGVSRKRKAGAQPDAVHKLQQRLKAYGGILRRIQQTFNCASCQQAMIQPVVMPCGDIMW